MQAELLTSTTFEVQTGPDPSPTILKLAAHLRRKAAMGEAPTPPATPAAICLQSKHDARIITLEVDRDSIRLLDGSVVDPKLTLEISFGQPLVVSQYRVAARSGTNPDLEKYLRQILAPVEADWTEIARTFWASHGNRAHMPPRLVLQSATGETYILGSPDAAIELRISGNVEALVDLCTGHTQLTAALVKGLLFAEGTWEAINAMNAACLREGLGAHTKPAPQQGLPV